MRTARADDADVHYDNVTRAWRFLLGDNLHYGLFEAPDEALDVATDRLTTRMAELAQLESGPRVVDVGCGIGTPSLWMAERFGCEVTGISTSEVGLGIARERAARRGLEAKVRFACRDGMDNQLDSASFDRAWVMESSHLMPQKDRLLKECARVLVPGGRLVLCDIILHADLELPQVLRRARAFRLLRIVFGRAKMETLATYRRLCEDAGLEVEHVEDITAPTAPTFTHWRANATRHEREVRELIGDAAWTDFIGSCDVLAQLWAEHVLGYGLLAAVRSTERQP